MFPAAPGDPLKISASDYNAAVEAGRQWMRQRRLGVGGQVDTPAINHGLIWIRNSTSGSLSRGAVVELSTPIVDTLTPRVLWLDGIVRAGFDPVCAVVLDPVSQLGIVPALMSGVCLADVDIIDADNTHARVVPGSTQLRGDFGGYCRIVYKPTGTGVKTCVVQVGETRTVRRKARATTTITDGGSGSADIYISGVARGNVTVHYNWLTGSGNISSGIDLFIDYYHDEDKWVVADAECEL